MSTCRSCGAGIAWAVTEDGKRIPLDLPPTPALVEVGELDDGTAVVATRPTWVTHFATCPDAGRWRRRG